MKTLRPISIALIAPIASLLVSPAQAVAPIVKLGSTTDHPSATIDVSGGHFGANEAVDIYFDATDTLLVTTNAKGAFVKHKLKVPVFATPGQHWITAIGRKTGDAAQKAFNVSTPWTEFGFTAAGHRTNPYENVISASTANQLDVSWVANMPGSNFYSSPAVLNGLVFVGGGSDDMLHAYDATNGTERWSATTGNLIASSPAVANGLVYVASGDGNLYAFNAATGAVAWSAPTGSTALSSPTIVDGIVYVGSGANLLAFNALTGAPQWTAAVSGQINYSSPAVANGLVFIADGFFGAGNLYAFRTSDGTLAWSAPTGGGIFSSPAVANGTVYIASGDGKMYAFDAKTGVARWSKLFDQGGGEHASPAIANGVVYCASSDDHLVAFNATTGAIVWNITTGFGTASSSPAVANGVVYVGADTGKLLAYNATSGAFLWGASVTSQTSASPTVSDGVVYMPGSNSRLYAFALNGGNNAVYKNRNTAPPSFASLHRDPKLTPEI